MIFKNRQTGSKKIMITREEKGPRLIKPRFFTFRKDFSNL